jgi:hypothetical protein
MYQPVLDLEPTEAGNEQFINVPSGAVTVMGEKHPSLTGTSGVNIHASA